MSDAGPLNGEQPTSSSAPVSRQLNEQDLKLLEVVGLHPAEVSDPVRKVLGRLSPRTKQRLLWSVDNWPGRVTFRLVNGLRDLQIFDRAMTVGAQLFPSVFPIIIMSASLFGGLEVSQAVGGGGFPPEVDALLDDVVSSTGGSGTFGVIGTLVVLISATSLSRALTRAYDTIWRHGRTRLPARGAWRWFAGVTVLAMSVVVTHKLVSLVQQVPPPGVWEMVTVVAVSSVIACYVPWLLMAGRVQLRLLLPGAVLFGVIMGVTRPLAEHYLAVSMAVSAERFGAIGVAFTSLTYLYCVSWALLGTAVLGRVIVIDPGAVGFRIRGDLTPDMVPGRGDDHESLFS